MNGTATYIDVLQFNGHTFSLAGFTLADPRPGKVLANGVLDSETIQTVLHHAVDESTLFAPWRVILTGILFSSHTKPSLSVFAARECGWCFRRLSCLQRLADAIRAWASQKKQQIIGRKQLEIFSKRGCGLKSMHIQNCCSN